MEAQGFIVKNLSSFTLLFEDVWFGNSTKGEDFWLFLGAQKRHARNNLPSCEMLLFGSEPYEREAVGYWRGNDDIEPLMRITFLLEET